LLKDVKGYVEAGGEAGFKRFAVIHLAGPSSAAVAYQ
jgi:hypothetical protein